MLKRKFDVICLTETWVRQPDLIDDVFSDYHSFHSIRRNRIGGRVVIYVSKQFACNISPIQTVNGDFMESVFVKLLQLGKSLIIGSCYRPSNSNYDMFNTFFKNKISSASSGSVNIVVCEDFNLYSLTISKDRFSSSFYKTHFHSSLR